MKFIILILASAAAFAQGTVNGPLNVQGGLTTIHCTTAGGCTFGTAALPASSIYIGSAATNNIRVTGTSAAARVVTIPDVGTDTGATVVLSPTSTTTTQVLKPTATAGLYAPSAISAGDLPTTTIGQKFFGTAAPGSVAGNLPGDLYTDTTNHNAYICNAPSGTAAPACTSVSAAGWLLLNTAAGSGGACTSTLAAGTNQIAAALAANAYICLSGDQAQNTSALSVSQANVTIDCLGHKITRSTNSTNLFTVTGNGFTVKSCILDGASQTTGYGGLITADGSTLQDSTLQNWGTNGGLGYWSVQSGSHHKILHNNILAGPGAGPDRNLFIYTHTGAIDDVLVDGNYVTVLADSQGLAFWREGSALSGLVVTNNHIKATGTCIYLNFSSGSQITEPRVIGNDCQTTATTGTPAYSVFGMINATFANNTYNDNGFSRVTQPAFAWHDTYSSALTGNTGLFSSNAGAPIQMLDSGRNSITGNTMAGTVSAGAPAAGWDAATPALSISTSATPTDIERNTITGNTFLSGPSYTGNLIEVKCTTASSLCSGTHIANNNLRGSTTGGSVGISLSRTNGTLANSSVFSNRIEDFPTGISVSSGASGTSVEAQKLANVSTPISDSGTSTQIWTSPTMSTTTTQALFATATAGAGQYRAIAAGDLPSTLSSGTAITNAALTTPAIGAATGASLLATGIVNGLVPIAINTGSNPCPTGTHCTFGTTYKGGYVYNQQTAGDRIYQDLPTAAAGLQWCIKNSVVGGTGAAVTGIITVKAQTGDYINNEGTIGSTGGVLSSAGAAGDGACFVSSAANHWEAHIGKGTWLP